jgi:outer membrane protein assembly factor BamB
MKKTALLTSIFAALLLGGCTEELPQANFELAQVKEVTAIVGDEQVMLSWLPIEGFSPTDFYVIWVSTAAEGGSISVPPAETSVLIGSLQNDVSYTFSVQPRYPNGLAGKVAVSCTPKSERQPVSNFMARAGDTKVKLTWTKPLSSQLTGYRITVNPGNRSIDVADPAAETYLVDNLTNSTEYTFSIIGIYPRGDSPEIVKAATPGEAPAVIVASATLVVFQDCAFEYNDLYFLGGTVQSFSWDFGDGGTSALEAPVHAYTVMGDYTVTLTVAYAGGATESGSIIISVAGYKWSELTLLHSGSSGYVKVSNPVFSPDGMSMYVPTSTPNGHLFAIDVSEGTVKWVFGITELTYGGGALVGSDGKIYQGSDAAIYAINPNGTEKWKVATSGVGALARVRAFPALSPDGATAYFVSNSAIYALSAVTGAEVWKKTLSELISSISVGSAVLVGNDGTVYVGTNMGLFALNGSTGAEVWRTTGIAVTESGSMAIHGNTIYAALTGGNGLASVNKTDGTLNWTQPADGDAYLPIVDKNGDVYFTEKATVPNVNVYAYKPDGTLKWKTAIASSQNYCGLALDENGIVYCGTNAAISGSRKVYGLSTADGEIVYTQNSAQQIMSSMTIGPDKRLYHGSIGASNVGGVFAYAINAGLEPAAWSVRGGDLQGTNRQK